MTTSEILASAWEALAKEKYGFAGVYERRVFSESRFSIFAAITRPSGRPLLLLQLVIPPATLPKLDLRGMSLKPTESGNRLALELTSDSFREIFLAVAVDLVTHTLRARDEQAAVSTLAARLDHWRRFLQAAGPEGLSRSQQIGLFGELLVFRTLVARVPERVALASWRGPTAENQDFFLAGRAIEVKTTSANDPDRVRITNERQLDGAGLVNLYLCHISVDLRENAGKSLPALIDDISAALTEDGRPIFSDSLVSAGYLESQRHLYLDTGYVERRRTYFAVGVNFPRITPAQLADGVAAVSYDLNLSACSAFRVTEQESTSVFAGGV